MEPGDSGVHAAGENKVDEDSALDSSEWFGELHPEQQKTVDARHWNEKELVNEIKQRMKGAELELKLSQGICVKDGCWLRAEEGICPQSGGPKRACCGEHFREANARGHLDRLQSRAWPHVGMPSLRRSTTQAKFSRRPHRTIGKLRHCEAKIDGELMDIEECHPGSKNCSKGKQTFVRMITRSQLAKIDEETTHANSQWSSFQD